MTVDKAQLFKPRLEEAEHEVPGIGTIRIRALNHDEAVAIADTKTLPAKQRKILAMGIVDPKLTEGEVGKWQMASPAGELTAVSAAISKLSGMDDEAEKAAVQSFRDEPGAGVGVLPGDEVGDDGGPDAAGDKS